MIVQLAENSQPLGTQPSELSEGQELAVYHAGVFYSFHHNYSCLDLVIGKMGVEGENVIPIRFNDNNGLDLEHADAFWNQLMEQLSEIQNLGP